MSAIHPLHVVVTGAGLTGLTTALLLARDGHRVTVLDRDPAPPPADAEQAWESWERPGVSQFRQPHLMLPRWTREIEREVPELLDRLGAAGAPRVNLLHLQPESVTGGWLPGDERFDTVAARRPVLEAALGVLAADAPGVVVRRGVRVHGLSAESGSARVPRVLGVRTSAGDVGADLVVDAGGRRTTLPGLVHRLGGEAPVEQREPCGFTYYSRHFRSPGRMPTGHGPVLVHHPSFSVLTLPGDDDTYCVVLITSSDDKPLRRLRDAGAWLAAARTSPVAAPWVEHGTPITPVMPLAGLEDVVRSYQRDGSPVVTGLVAVGDSAAGTNPSLGRGATLGLLHACALRDTLATATPDPREQVDSFEAATAARIRPWVEASTWYDRHRLGEMHADVAGTAYLTEDVAWSMSTALMAGAAEDPVLSRASSLLGSLLATPDEVFADPELGRRLTPHLGGPRYAPDGPTRAGLLRAVETGDTAGAALAVS